MMRRFTVVTIAWTTFFLFSVSADAQITETDVAKAINEHLTKVPGFCIAYIGIDSADGVIFQENIEDAKTKILQQGYASINKSDGHFVVNDAGKKFVIKKAWPGSDGHTLYGCFAVGRVKLSKVTLFGDPQFGESEISYIIEVEDIPNWVHPNPRTLISYKTVLHKANGRWMTRLTYRRLQQGID